MKDYTYTMKIKTEDGKIEYRNETDTAKGYRKSWYKTEEKARERLDRDIRNAEFYNYVVLEWTLYNRNNGIGIIEEYKA